MELPKHELSWQALFFVPNFIHVKKSYYQKFKYHKVFQVIEAN